MTKIFYKDVFYELQGRSSDFTEKDEETLTKFFRAFSLFSFIFDEADDTLYSFSEENVSYEFKFLTTYGFYCSPLNYMRRIVNEFDLSEWNEVEDIIYKVNDLCRYLHDDIKEIVIELTKKRNDY